MRKSVVSVLILSCAAQIAFAEGNLRLVGEDLAWPAGQQSQQMTLRVAKTTADDIAVAGWQLRCQIIPRAGASGMIYFADSPFSTESPFWLEFSLFQEENGPTPPAITDPSWLIVGTAPLPEPPEDFFGVEIPDTGMNLLQIGLTNPTEASGIFDIAVFPSVPLYEGVYSFFGAEWYSTNSAEPMAFEGMPFAPSPFDVAPVVVGSVSIGSVPEPPSAVLALSGVIMGIIIAHRTTRRWRTVPSGTVPHSPTTATSGPIMTLASDAS